MPSITEILDEHNVDFVGYGEHHHASPGWVNVDCPHCGMSGKFRLGLALTGRSANCYVCGVFKIWEVLPQVLGLTRAKAYPVISSIVPSEGLRVERRTLVDLPETVELDSIPGYMRYLKDRGFDHPESLALLWGLKGTPLHSRLKWRIFIPIHDPDFRLVSWTTRTIGNKRQRYISASPFEESYPHKHLLFGEHLIANRERVIITEGPFDAMRIGPGAVATFGLAITPAQVERIKQYARRHIMFDGSRDAYNRALKLEHELQSLKGSTWIVKLNDGVDPGSLTTEQAEQFREQFLT